MQRFLKWIFISISVVLGALLTIIISLSLFLPNIEAYHGVIEQKIEQTLREHVQIKHISLEFQGLQPVVTFKNIEVSDQQRHSLMTIGELKLGINIVKSILFWKLEPQDLVVCGTQLNLREEANGILHINNISALQANLHSLKNEKLEQLLHWFLNAGNKKLSQIKVNWLDKNNQLFPIYIDNLDGDSRFLLHQYHGKIILANSAVSSFEAKIIGLASFQRWLNGNIEIIVNELPIAKALTLFQINNEQKIIGNTNVISKLSWGPSNRLRISNYVEANDVNITTKQQKKLIVNSVRGNFWWESFKQGWRISFADMQLQLNNELLPVKKGKFEVQNSPGELPKQYLQLNILPLKKINDIFIKYDLLPKHFAEQWLHFNPQGEIHDFKLVHIGNLSDSRQFRLSGDLHSLTFKQWKSYPGITNLSGYIVLTPRSGYLKLDSNQFGFNYPKLFRTAIVADKLKSTISWKKADKQWQIDLRQLYIRNQDATASGRAKLFIPIHGNPSIQSKIEFHVDDMHHAYNYLPVGIMPKPLVQWLDHAFSDGKLSDGEMILEGALKDFPYVNKPGKFIVQANMQNVSLKYLPDWPVLTRMAGIVRFEKDSLLAKVNYANMLSGFIQNGSVNIPNLRHAKLFLKGLAYSSHQSEQIINQQNFPKLTQKIGQLSVQGMWKLGLQLAIPIDTSVIKEPLKIAGQLQLNNASITSQKLDLSLKQMKGNINFTENNVSSDQLIGKIFNHDFYFNLSNAPNNKNVQLKFSGQLAADDLHNKFNLPILKNILGSTAVNGLLEFSKDPDGVASNLVISSDLKGVNLNLPQPFTKQEKTLQHTTVNLKFHPTQQSTISFNYGDQLNGLFNFNLHQNRFNFDGGVINVGKQIHKFTSEKGLQLEGELPEFNWTEWRKFINQNNFAKAKAFDMQSLISKINLKINKLIIDEYKLEDATITAESDHKNWLIAVNSSKLRGQITLPNAYPSVPIQAKLEHLSLDDVKTNLELKPSDVPPLDLSIANLVFKEKNIKHLQLTVIPQGKQLWIKQLHINEPLYTLNASGWWRQLNNHMQNTSLQGELKSSNIGAVLNQLHITDNMVLGSGAIQFDLAWQNSPISPRVSTMNGQLGLQFKSGRIIHLSQQASMGLGIGRVLNLLSLQTLPRRLALDFSDITSPGFPYDEMKGNFVLRNGNVYTDNADLEGPLAKVHAQGKIGLENKDYHLRLIITPDVTSSLPLVATLTAGPIAGAITWAADKILSRQVKKITQIHYNVTGTWSKPNVVQMS